MNVLKISDERYDVVLPQTIKDSEVLNVTDKKVLGAILHYFLILDKAKENKYVILTNEDLRKSIGIRKSDMIKSIQNLIEYKLIKRECGKPRTSGEKAQASKYYINWDNLKRPIKKPCFEDLFSSFISSETPLGTVDTDIDTDVDIDTEIDKDTHTYTIDVNTIERCSIPGVSSSDNNVNNETLQDSGVLDLNKFGKRSDDTSDVDEERFNEEVEKLNKRTLQLKEWGDCFNSVFGETLAG